MSRNDVRFNLRMPDGILREVMKEVNSDKSVKSVSDVVRQLLFEWLANRRCKPLAQVKEKTK